MSRLSALCTLALALAILCTSTLALAQEAPAPLSEDQQKIFMSSKQDQAAQKLLGVNAKYEGRSYLAGDEWNLHLFQPHIKDIGGGYMGVGADQGYLLIGWAKPELAWLVDYDEAVIATHRLHRAFFLHAKTPEEFINLWKNGAWDEANKAINAQWKGRERQEALSIYRSKWRSRIYVRLRRLSKTLTAAKVPSYLTDQAQYDYVRNLIKNGRVRVMVANLLDKRGVKGVGEAAKQLNVPIRTLYLSNAEEYWSYPKQYRENIATLHFDERSRVVRTLSTWSTNGDYRYAIQSAMEYVDWLKGGVWKVYGMIPRRKLEGKDDIDFIDFKTKFFERKAAKKARPPKKKSK